MKSLFIFFGSISLTIIILAGCAKQNLTTKPYHNITGRYNAYYNANLRVEESFSMLNSQHQDNYNNLLHMYPYAAATDANSVKQPLDEAITKCARNIKLHEVGNWTDDSYHLMGQAEFLQQEYERAANTFKFVVDKYHPENVAKELEKLKKKKKKKKGKGKKRKKRKKKKRKKKKGKKKPNKNPEEEEEEKPIKYGLKHRPVRYKAMLWLAKTYIELGQYDDAGYYLRQLENDKKVPKKLRSEVHAVIAYNWITQKEYEKAVEPLVLAIEGTKKKPIKNRYVYVLGQIYQMQSNNQMAMENFHDVLRLRPSYEMEFNARLNMATNAASASGKKVIDPEIALKRMLRDSKNEEYKDQIYFALAKIKLQSGKKDEGILALQQSLNYSASNAQRAEGALLLAELFYEKDDFVRAYAYYDSTVQVMDKNDERYVTTEMYKRRLKGVATYVAIKEDKDSMLIVGSWERKKQEAWAITGMEMDEINAQNRGAEASTVEAPRGGGTKDFRKREGRSLDPQSVNGERLPVRTNKKTTSGKVTISDAALQKSKFSLYNASLKKKGEREFEKRWNNRAWVDDWRRSDREEDVNNVEDDIVVVEPKTQAEIDAYLKKKGVPTSDQEIASNKVKIGEAIYKAAEHYREDLGRTDKALELVEELVYKYPNNTYTVEGMFLAYNIYSEKNNISKATYYKNEILKRYPESNIAKVLSDPEFANSERLKYEKINKYYDDTYAMIQGGEAEKALGRVRAIPTEFGSNYEMKARFAILEAMCVGGMKGEQDYIKALRIIVTSFPDTKEEKQAKEMIVILSGKNGRRGGSKNKKTNLTDGKGIYKVNKKIKHFILIVFDNKKTKVNQYRAPLTEYNNKFHLNKKLSVSTILVDAKIPTLIVRGAYPNADEAMKYVVNARSNKEFLPEAKGYTIYAISSENYGIAMTTQKFHMYSTFFETHYR
jgi:tetratricopeptide (TPR) repeat protein